MITYVTQSCSNLPLSVIQAEQWFDTDTCKRFREKPLQKQRCSLAGRMMAKRAVYTLLKHHAHTYLSLHDIHLSNDIQGKPQVDNLPVHISISHTKKEAIALAVFSYQTNGVGIDREYVRIFKRKTVHAFLNKEEMLWCQGSLDKKRRETLCWSYKESFLKAIGTGLRIHPKNVTLIPVSEQYVLITYGSYRAEGHEIASPKKDTITTIVTLV